MSSQPAVRVLGIGFTTRQLAILLAIAILGLHPFVFATVSPSPYFLALPWWYYANVGVLVAIYLLIQLYVSTTTDDAAEGVGGDP